MYQYDRHLVKELNHSYQTSGLRCFGFNQIKLSHYYGKKAQRANLDYFNAYLVLVVYLTYCQLFHLKHYMKDVYPPAYWYNSPVANTYHAFCDSIVSSGHNPVSYLSYRFSSFKHQSKVYGHVYDYTPSERNFGRGMAKYVRYRKNQHFDFYYCSGNPVLDLAYVYFQNQFAKFISPQLATLSDVQWDINTKWEQMQRLLRMSDTAFKSFFGHERFPIERKLIKTWNPNAIYMAFGIPTEPQTFSWLSPRIIRYTHNLTTNLFGIESNYRGMLAIPKYKLYGIKRGKDIYRVLATITY